MFESSLGQPAAIRPPFFYALHALWLKNRVILYNSGVSKRLTILIALLTVILFDAAAGSTADGTGFRAAAPENHRDFPLGEISGDKIVHFIGGFMAAFAGMATFASASHSDFFDNPLAASLGGIMIGSVVGGAKELVDAFMPERHSQERLDLLATVLGGWIGGLAAGGLLASTRNNR